MSARQVSSMPEEERIGKRCDMERFKYHGSSWYVSRRSQTSCPFTLLAVVDSVHLEQIGWLGPWFQLTLRALFCAVILALTGVLASDF
jgi:hypothetical protein